MNKFKIKLSLTQLQYLIWLGIILISFFAMLSADGLAKSASSALINACFYALIVYGNISFLYPKFYLQQKHVQYFFGSVVLLIVAGFFRGYANYYAGTTFFNLPTKPLDLKTHFTFFISGATVFILSYVFRLAIAYFSVKQQTEEILLQKSQFELNLLKSQVQPHFLFNTLNNIYYEAYREAPRTALLIEKLSGIMRYFVDEGTADKVLLSTEVKFLENYIELENIRIRHETIVDFKKSYDSTVRIPPMLLMTFVENIYKHGIDKSSEQNNINIRLTQTGRWLEFETKNNIQPKNSKETSGMGLSNLQKRLSILNGNLFEMNTSIENGSYMAYLKIPIDES